LSEKERGVFDRLLGLFQGEQEAPPTEEELFEIINASGETGVITDDTHEMLSRVIQLKETQVQEVMVPRTEFSAIAADSRIKTAISIINDKGFSRYPIFHDTLDQVIGILHAKDILKHLDKNLEHLNLREIMRPVYFVPETKKVDDLLREMQQRRVHMAIVVDEYGGTAGLVTVEDILEEIVGEIQDEYDAEEPVFVQVSEAEYILDARVDVDDVNDLLDVNLPTESGDTLGGLIYASLGKVPSPGERLRIDGLLIEVMTVSERRIRKVRVQRELMEEQEWDRLTVRA